MKLLKKIFSTRYGLLGEIEALEAEQARLHEILNSVIMAPKLLKSNNPHKKESQGILIGLTAASNAVQKAIKGEDNGKT